MRVIGLTGGIATGKSTVSKLLQDRGFPVIDCDLIAREVVQPGRWGHRRVVGTFGTNILKPDGQLDREALGQLVFSDGAARARLNAATHLPIYAELLRQLLWHWLTLKWVVVLDMPLMVETGSYRAVRALGGTIVVVVCGAATQLARLRARNALSEADARARVDAQMPVAAKAAVADVVLDNERGLDALGEQVERLAGRVRRRAGLWGWLTSPVAALGVLAAGALALRRLL